jgi:hypothetical protein
MTSYSVLLTGRAHYWGCNEFMLEPGETGYTDDCTHEETTHREMLGAASISGASKCDWSDGNW